MTTQTYAVDISASRERIWATLTERPTYREWTKAFCDSSEYVGDWSVGNEMKFIDTRGEKECGLVSTIVEHVPGEIIRARHLGMIENGVENRSPDNDWVGAREEYRLTGGPSVYTLTVTQDLPEAHVEAFSGMWKDALARLKALAEAA